MLRERKARYTASRGRWKWAKGGQQRAQGHEVTWKQKDTLAEGGLESPQCRSFPRAWNEWEGNGHETQRELKAQLKHSK